MPSALWSLLLATILTAATGGAPGLGMLVAGAVCVMLYRRHKPDTHLNAGMGAKLGAFTGVLGCALLLVTLAMAVGVFHAGGRIHQAVLEFVQQALSSSPAQKREQTLEILKTADGLALMVIGICIACVLFSSAGGALGAFLLRHKRKP